MTYKCLVVDDEELARRLMSNHLSQLDNFELVASCDSAIAASKILKENHIDLLFLDIEMPVLKGVDFFKNLQNKPRVIFTTAYRNYAVEGFELDAVDYLLKPITFARFFKSIEKFESLQRSTDEKAPASETPNVVEHLFIREDRKQVKVRLKDIRYIESIKDYIRIHTSETQHLTKQSITTFYDLLDTRFVRVHRSFIVNSDYITAFTHDDVEIGEVEIPIGQSYKKDVADFLS